MPHGREIGVSPLEDGREANWSSGFGWNSGGAGHRVIRRSGIDGVGREGHVDP